MPSIVSKAIELVRNEEMNTLSANYDDSDFGDINNPESYFYHIHQMPEKLPKLIRLLISKTPGIYRPAVSQAIFPPLASHLCETRFRYLDNVEHEATISSILCAPTGSGKEAITQPINHIMADIRKRDAEQRERERLWKDECNRKGSNKDKRERPQGLVIQEVNIDMTNPAFVLRMKEAENHFLYSKLNELNLFDALKGKTNQHFRIMELAFDLGNYGQDRVGTQSVTETIKVRFNWNACCTPKKCREYFKRVVTDGPISRISFSTIERRPCGSELPVYGTYDAAFDEQLKPYIDNLVKARGLVDCPGARKLAQTLLDENAQFARLSQDVVFENLSFRANVIAYLKACVLYVANGMKWEKSIADFVRWSERLEDKREFRDTFSETLLDKEHYFCDTLEPTWRNLLGITLSAGEVDARSGRVSGKVARKVRGKTAIPEGSYPLLVTPSPRFKCFLPLVQGVPGFEGIRIHAGNYPDDTQGCILVGENKFRGMVVNSRIWLNRLISRIAEAREQGESVWITVI